MPRKKKKTTPVETPITPERATETADSFAAELPQEGAPPAAEAPALAHEELTVLKSREGTGAPSRESTADSAPPARAPEETVPEGATLRGRFRSWVSDTARGYSRLTDEQEQRVVLQFAQKPAADVLTAIKGAGFQFLADYEGLSHVWVRRNDFETRLQVEAIEKLIGSLPQRDSAAR